MYMYINKLGSRSYSYIHLKSFHICVIHLVLERCYFEAVLPKKRLHPLGVNVYKILIEDVNKHLPFDWKHNFLVEKESINQKLCSCDFFANNFNFS